MIEDSREVMMEDYWVKSLVLQGHPSMLDQRAALPRMWDSLTKLECCEIACHVEKQFLATMEFLTLELVVETLLFLKRGLLDHRSRCP